MVYRTPTDIICFSNINLKFTFGLLVSTKFVQIYFHMSKWYKNQNIYLWLLLVFVIQLKLISPLWINCRQICSNCCNNSRFLKCNLPIRLITGLLLTWASWRVPHVVPVSEHQRSGPVFLWKSFSQSCFSICLFVEIWKGVVSFHFYFSLVSCTSLFSIESKKKHLLCLLNDS